MSDVRHDRAAPPAAPAHQEHIELTETYAAHNYHPLPVVLASGEGAWVTDVDGKRYLDCLAGYSALNFGHGHPRLLAVAHAQLDRADADQPRVLQRPAGPVREGPGRAHRQGPGPADELRRRGRRDRDQGQPPLGLRGQGRRRGAGLDHRHGGQLPRPHDHDRQLQRRRGRHDRLRAVHAGLPDGAVRRHRRHPRRASTTPRSPSCSSRSRARAA